MAAGIIPLANQITHRLPHSFTPIKLRHNARYWKRQSVLGLGMGAHSMEARSEAIPHGARAANPRDLKEWRSAVERDERACEFESLSVAAARGEAVFLALRQREGLDARRFSAEFGHSPRTYFAAAIDRLVERGWLAEGEPGPGDLRLTAPGRLFADSVAMEFVSDASAEGD